MRRENARKRAGNAFQKTSSEADLHDLVCSGWEIVCPDGRVRHYPYHNHGDAQSHAEFASDPKWFAKRGCRLGPESDELELSQPPCPGGDHVARPIMLVHHHGERGAA